VLSWVVTCWEGGVSVLVRPSVLSGGKLRLLMVLSVPFWFTG